jgi:hypothetical protein
MTVQNRLLQPVETILSKRKQRVPSQHPVSDQSEVTKFCVVIVTCQTTSSFSSNERTSDGAGETEKDSSLSTQNRSTCSIYSVPDCEESVQAKVSYAID